jgi:hypothetical protein
MRWQRRGVVRRLQWQHSEWHREAASKGVQGTVFFGLFRVLSLLLPVLQDGSFLALQRFVPVFSMTMNHYSSKVDKHRKESTIF